MSVRVATAALFAALGACGEIPTPAQASFVLRVVAGPSGVSAAPSSGASPGRWLITPDRVRLRVTSVGLYDSSGGRFNGYRAEPDCEVSLERSTPRGQTLADCPFSVNAELPAGGVAHYDQYVVGFSPQYELLIDDASAGLYTAAVDPLLRRTPPDGGATFATVGTDAPPSLEIGPPARSFSLPAGSNVLTVAISPLQFARATVSDTGASFGWSGAASPGIPLMMEGNQAFTSMTYYVRSDIGTALSYNTDRVTPSGIRAIAVFDASDGPQGVDAALDAQPGGCAPVGAQFFDTLGYVGRDPTGVLAWAAPSDSSWQSYGAVFAMRDVSALGGTAQVACKRISSDPRPPGDSFSSGAPVIDPPDYETQMVLVAN